MLGFRLARLAALRPVANVRGPGDYGGNSVTREIAPGVYAFYAHVQPGSGAVAPGDRVASVQVLGLLGNTGAPSHRAAAQEGGSRCLPQPPRRSAPPVPAATG